MTRYSTRLAMLAAALLLAFPVLARAGDPPTGAASAAAGQRAQGGPLVLEPIHDGFVITPDVKVTDVDHSTRTLVGAYGGWLKENTLLLGAGGYWMANGSRDRSMAYGGFVTQWTMPIGRAVRVGARALLGGGRARLSRSVTYRIPIGFNRDYGRTTWHGNGDLVGTIMAMWQNQSQSFTTQTFRARYETNFLIAEPQADLVVQVAPWLALNAGVGYRAVGWANGLERNLRGAVGSLGVRIGG